MFGMSTIQKHSIVGFWKSVENQRAFLEVLKKKFGIKEPQDWGKIVIEDVKKEGGERLLATYGDSMYSVLKYVYGG